MTINENRVRFTGHHVEIPEPYELGANILFKGEGEIAQIQQKDGGDGTYCQIHLLRPKLVELAASEAIFKSEPTVGKFVGKSKSKQLRDLIFVYWDQQLKNKYPNFETYYDAVMDKFINEWKEKLV